MTDRDAKLAFLILAFMRVSGAAFAVFGLAIVAGRIHLPQMLGVGLVLMGAFEATVIPAILAKKWKSPE